MVSDIEKAENCGCRCMVCSEPSKSKCSNCNQVYYCSVNHQKQDWKNHKKECHPYKIESNEKFGRYLVASRNIKPGEIVLKEAALVCVPSQITGPVCVGCMKGLMQFESLECERCGWPICQRECQNCADHAAECEFTTSFRGCKVNIQHFVAPHPTYQCLAILRCLLLKDKDPCKWEKLLNFESHEEIRRGSKQWRSDLEGIAKFISRFFKCNKWSEEEIMKVAGVLHINGHEVPLSEPAYVAIYNQASLIQHSCHPNIFKSFSKKGDIFLWAPNAIKKGSNLSICYSDVLWGTALWGTASRQHHLQETKFFLCDCDRCKDVTEFGTNFSAILCNKKKCKGLALPLSLEAWNDNWTCRTCNETVEKGYITDILDRAGKDLAAMQKGSEDNCVRYINHYSKWLYKNHHYLVEVKIALVQLIGNIGPKLLQSISNESLDTKISICKDMIDLIEIVASAEARVLGILHFELHAALAERARRSSEQNNDICKLALEESLTHVNISINLLQHEPAVLSEGQMYAQAKINKASIKIVLGLPL